MMILTYGLATLGTLPIVTMEGFLHYQLIYLDCIGQNHYWRDCFYLSMIKKMLVIMWNPNKAQLKKQMNLDTRKQTLDGLMFIQEKEPKHILYIILNKDKWLLATYFQDIPFLIISELLVLLLSFFLSLFLSLSKDNFNSFLLLLLLRVIQLTLILNFPFQYIHLHDKLTILQNPLLNIQHFLINHLPIQLQHVRLLLLFSFADCFWKLHLSMKCSVFNNIPKELDRL